MSLKLPSFRPRSPVRARNRVRFSIALFSLLASSLASAVPPSERAFLLDLYQNMNPSNWANQTGWNGPAGTECTWYGITCDATQEHVIGVELVGNGLYGTLPASLSEQSQLRVFNLRANDPKGPIPSLSKLVNLEHFDVTAWGDGFYPDAGLTGSIPSLDGLTRLKVFKVGLNKLTGPLPSFGAASGLQSLEVFEALRNQLSGPIGSFTGVPALREFDASRNNGLSGSLPPIAHLAQLELFVVTFNQLTGKVPEIAGMQRLKYFYIAFNQFDEINASFDDLPALEEYSANSNLMTGQIVSLAGVPKLRQFFVASNRLSGPLPALSHLSELSWMQVHQNQFTGSLPALQTLQNLNYFHAHANQFTGPMPALAGMQSLQGFRADHNQLEGPIPPLSDLPMLFDFVISHNRLSGSLPAMENMPWLSRFQVQHNQLTGQVPEIQHLEMLSTFNVSHNALTGPPPAVNYNLSPGDSGDGSTTALCPNHLDPVESWEWDYVTGTEPWFQDCTAVPDTLFADGFEQAAD